MRNANLRRCSAEQRGVWIDVMCLMHDSEEYGVLRWPLKEIAQAVGVKVTVLRALVDRQVLKGADTGQAEALIYIPRHARQNGDPIGLIGNLDAPVWYSSRMVLDEHKRSVRADNRGDTKGHTEAHTKAFTNGGHRCSTKGLTNPRTFPANSKSNLSREGDVTTLSQGEEGPW